MSDEKNKDYCVSCGIKIKKGLLNSLFGKPQEHKPVEYRDGIYCYPCHIKKSNEVFTNGQKETYKKDWE